MRECRSACAVPRSGARYTRAGVFVFYFMLLTSPHYDYGIHTVSAHCNSHIPLDGYSMERTLLEIELSLIVVPCAAVIVKERPKIPAD